VTGQATEVNVGRLDSVEPGCALRVEVGDVALCVGRLEDGSPFAVADECTHDEVELSDGYIDGDEFECSAHGSRFNVHTGAATGLPADVLPKVYPIKVEDDELVVEVDAAPARGRARRGSPTSPASVDDRWSRPTRSTRYPIRRP
jgi:3-phenylpropionate/trans-cinnamate dioxygenase ferredoxin component